MKNYPTKSFEGNLILLPRLSSFGNQKRKVQVDTIWVSTYFCLNRGSAIDEMASDLFARLFLPYLTYRLHLPEYKVVVTNAHCFIPSAWNSA